MSETLIPTDPFAKLPMTFRLYASNTVAIEDARAQASALVRSARERGLVVRIHEDQATFSTIFTIDKATKPAL